MTKRAIAKPRGPISSIAGPTRSSALAPSPKAPTILVADDDPVSSRILEKNMTDWGHRILKARNGDDAWTALQNPRVRIAVLDWMMPGLDGLEICRRMRENPRTSYTYIILLTSKDTPKDIIAGIQAGADDYMTKPVNFLELQARLQTGRRIIELEDSLLEIQKRLTELATRDGLTGLWNRGAILKFLEEEIEHGSRDGYATSIIMIDVDHFKAINDLHGHQAGDAVLRSVTDAVHKSVRPYDKVGRYGGDEILVVLPNCSLYQVSKIAERIRSAGAARKIRPAGRPIMVSLSLGCTSSECFLEPEVDGLILASDKALYEAKRDGRNRVSLSDAVEDGPARRSGKGRGRAR
jgi:diguanylate cyclase (GGDEF)-like protein